MRKSSQLMSAAAELALPQDAGASLSAALGSAGVGVWETDLRSGHGRWLNDWCRSVDLDPCEGANHIARWQANIHPEDTLDTQRRFRQALEGAHDPYHAEYRIRDGRNNWRWVFERGRVVERNADGTPIRMVGVCMDIAARKEAQLEAAREQRRLEIALEVARGGTRETSLKEGTTRFSEFYFRILGEPSDPAPKPSSFWASRLHPEDLQRASEAAQEVAEGRRETYEVEYRLRHADGSWRWVLDRGRAIERDATGRASHMVGFVVDVTDRVRTEEALRRSEFRYRSIASMVPGYVFELRFVGEQQVEQVWISEGAETIYGCTLEELQSAGGRDALLDAESLESVKGFRAALRRGEPQSGEVRVRTLAGEVKWLHGDVMPVRDPITGAVTGAIGAVYEVTKRKLAEEALRESEAILRSVTENTPDWLMLIDEQFHVRFMNHACARYQTDQVMGRNLLEFIPEGERERVGSIFRSVFSTGQQARFEMRSPMPDGSSRDCEYRLVPVVDAGRIRFLSAVVTDVTEAKRAAHALRESQSILETVAANSADWLALFDLQRRCIFLNRALHGRPPEAWIGQTVESFVPIEDRARVHDIFEHVMRTGEPRDFAQVITDRERGLRYLELRVRAVQNDGRFFGTAVNITEVTEQHAQREALRTQARILETMREGVVLVDAATDAIRLTNAAFDRMFGYEVGELLGQRVAPLLSMSAVQRRRFERMLHESSRGAEPTPLDLECARRDGSRFMVTCLVTPLVMGGTDHWIAVLNDITERKRLEREIIEIANREQQRIGSDLHDGLGQDLTGIALILRSVAAQLRKEGSGARLDVEDVIGLVNNAIDSTRALARGLSPVSSDRGGLAGALQGLATRARERYGFHVEFVGDGVDLPLDETSATHLYRIAQEAFTNVVRHGHASRVTITLEIVGEELHLRIEDNGRGFGNSLPERAGGLGLKIMRYRTQILGGDLVLEDAPGGGASVRCSCPLERLISRPELAPRRAGGRHR